MTARSTNMHRKTRYIRLEVSPAARLCSLRMIGSLYGHNAHNDKSNSDCQDYKVCDHDSLPCLVDNSRVNEKKRENTKGNACYGFTINALHYTEKSDVRVLIP